MPPAVSEDNWRAEDHQPLRMSDPLGLSHFFDAAGRPIASNSGFRLASAGGQVRRLVPAFPPERRGALRRTRRSLQQAGLGSVSVFKKIWPGRVGLYKSGILLLVATMLVGCEMERGPSPELQAQQNAAFQQMLKDPGTWK